MTLTPILHYFGLAFLLFHLIRLFPFKLDMTPKILQLTILLALHGGVIFFMPAQPLFRASLLLVVTLLFTLFSDNLKQQFYKNYFTIFLKGESLPELLLLLNWDFHSLALVKLKRAFPDLANGNSGVNRAFLERLAKYPGLVNDSLWHQDLLQILHFSDRLDLAAVWLEKANIDFTKSGLPYGLITILCKLYLRLDQPESAAKTLHYLEIHYHDSQHHLLNLANYMIYFALKGDLPGFTSLMAAYPLLQKNLTVPYWQGICLLRLGQQAEAFRLFEEFEKKLPAGLDYFLHYINRIRENPALYPPLPASKENLTQNFFPRPLASQDHLPLAAGVKPRIVYLLCGLIGLTTLIQFILSGPGSIREFFSLSAMTSLDFLKAGAYAADYIRQGQWIRLSTACFLHGGWLHLLLNLYGLFQIGRVIERFYGGIKMFFIFLLAGICGNLLTLLTGYSTLSIGASGGVFGILAALVVYFFWYRKVINKTILRNFLVNFAVIIGINVLLGIRNPRINNMAHLGGFLGGGAVAGLLLFMNTRKAALKQLGNHFIKISVILMLVVTFSLWPGLLNYDYYSNTKLEKTERINGYTVSIPADWIIDDEGALLDQLSLTKNIIFYNNSTTLPVVVKNNEALQDFLVMQQSGLLDAPAAGVNWISHREVSALPGGWFFFSLKLEKPDPAYYSYQYFYAKLFPSSLCIVQNIRNEEAAGYDGLLLRVLESIREE